MKECVAAQPATGAIAVAGKSFTFDAVCDDTMGQARPARAAHACRRVEPFSTAVQAATRRARRALRLQSALRGLADAPARVAVARV